MSSSLRIVNAHERLDRLDDALGIADEVSIGVGRDEIVGDARDSRRSAAPTCADTSCKPIANLRPSTAPVWRWRFAARQPPRTCPTASFAGQHDSFLNVRGADAVVEACRRCFASIFTDRAISYCVDNGFEHFKVVAVMKMVKADAAASGVAYHTGVAGFSPEDLFGGIDFVDIFGGSTSGGPACSIASFAGGHNVGGGKTWRSPSTYHWSASPGAASEETVHVARPVTCQACHGSGAKAGTAPRTCPKCNGKGQIVGTHREHGVTLQQISTCAGRASRGSIIDTPFRRCRTC